MYKCLLAGEQGNNIENNIIHEWITWSIYQAWSKKNDQEKKTR